VLSYELHNEFDGKSIHPTNPPEELKAKSIV